MEFTYLAYEKLIKQLKDKGYKFCDYTNYIGENKAVILRHQFRKIIKNFKRD